MIRTAFTDLVGYRVFILAGRYAWRGLLTEECGPFLILNDARQMTWADADQLREEIDQTINGLRLNAAFIEGCYLESECRWAQDKAVKPKKAKATS